MRLAHIPVIAMWLLAVAVVLAFVPTFGFTKTTAALEKELIQASK
jgi:hypothetical protein